LTVPLNSIIIIGKKVIIPGRRYDGMKGAALCFLVCFTTLILPSPVNTQGIPASHRADVLAYAGRYFENPSSPHYASYDQKMTMDVAKRIRERYHVDLDYKSYSAFDLLEIEALLKCKRSDESVESLLERFQS
jgi:hypothetical protein